MNWNLTYAQNAENNIAFWSKTIIIHTLVCCIVNWYSIGSLNLFTTTLKKKWGKYQTKKPIQTKKKRLMGHIANLEKF